MRSNRAICCVMIVVPLFVACCCSAFSEGQHASPDPPGEIAINGINLIDPRTGKDIPTEYPDEVGSHPAWSPDRTRIAYVVNSPSRASNAGIWTVNLRTHRKRHITRSTYDGYPAWSPDGKHVAFVREMPRNGHTHAGGFPTAIHVVNLRDKSVRQVTEGKYLDNNPVWSPDGKRLAFSSDRNGKHKIWILEVAQKRARLLPNQPELSCYEPMWDHIRGNVYYLANSAGEEDVTPQLYIQPESGKWRRLIKLPRGAEGRMAISPDSGWIAYQRGSDKPGQQGAVVFISKLDGTGERRLRGSFRYSIDIAW